MKTLNFGHDAFIYKKNDTGCHIYGITSGAVKLYRNGKLVDLLRVGDVFGRFSSEAISMGEDAVAVGATEVTQYDGIDVPTASLLLAIARRTDEQHERIVTLMHKNAPSRLACVILRLTSGEQQQVHKGITQQDLADLAGMTRSFASTTINELKRVGILQSSGRNLFVKDTKRLNKLASELAV